MTQKNVRESIDTRKNEVLQCFPQKNPLIIKLQKVQYATAGYVFRRSATILNLINLYCLSMKDHLDFSTVKLMHQSPRSELWPNYLLVDRVK